MNKDNNNIFPNFLIIGAPKSGTTSLYQYLKQHPQIYMSSIKEPHFFVLGGKKLVDFHPTYSNFFSYSVPSLSDYNNLFSGTTNEIAIGEASAKYLYHECAVNNIKKYVPDAKLIVILRHPVDRAYSQYCGRRRLGLEKIKSFFEAIDQEDQRRKEAWDPGFYYLDMSFYYRQLKRYYDAFNKDQIQIFFYDDLKTDAVQVCQHIFNFLNVDSSFCPKTDVAYNAGYLPKNQELYSFLKNSSKLGEIIIPQKLYKLFKSSVKDSISPLFEKKIPKLNSTERENLIKIYEKDILSLQELIEKDLTHWLH